MIILPINKATPNIITIIEPQEIISLKKQSKLHAINYYLINEIISFYYTITPKIIG